MSAVRTSISYHNVSRIRIQAVKTYNEGKTNSAGQDLSYQCVTMSLYSDDDYQTITFYSDGKLTLECPTDQSDRTDSEIVSAIREMVSAK